MSDAPPPAPRVLVGVPLKGPLESRTLWLLAGSGLLWLVTMAGDIVPGLGIGLPAWVPALVALSGVGLTVLKTLIRLSDPDIVTRVPWLDGSNARAAYFDPTEALPAPPKGPATPPGKG